MSGTRVGPYEIQSALGAGGMGEVYKARDTRLDRTVAIKVLPEVLAADPQFRERFDREARAISSLNHPHICTLHDIGNQNGIDYLVMEYLEGETLADRLKKGALSFDQALQYAIQIADALDKAHRQGITHRDLKPGNVMLTKTGAKLLDFGLAKTKSLVVAGTGLSMLPTTPPDLTAQGTILGTFQYMAPEQLEGNDADARTDIFAFGSLVYEMVTGRKTFEGQSHAGLIGAILRDEPPPMSTVTPSRRPGSTPSGASPLPGIGSSDVMTANLDRIVRRCLAKSPADRWQTASDLLEALRWVSEGRAPIAPVATAARRGWLERVAWAIALVGAMALAAWGWLRPPVPAPLTRFTVTLPHEDTLTLQGLALSPDGRRVVFTAHRGTVDLLYRRDLDQLEAIPIRGTEDGLLPFFSPDGKWLGFFTRNALKKVPIEGGPPSTIAPADFRRGASWGRDDTIVSASDRSPDLMRVSAGGGTPEVLVSARDFKDARLWWPVWTPDGNTVLFTVSGSQESQIAAYSMKTRQRRVVADGSTPRYLASGHLLFGREGSLWAVLFNPGTLATAGSPAPVLEGVQINAGGLTQFNVSPNGSLAFIPGVVGASGTVAWLTRDGAREPLLDKPQAYVGARVSPDGRRVAIAIASAEASGTDIWMYDPDTRALGRLTFDSRVSGRTTEAPVWTPDGGRLIYTYRQGTNWSLFWTSADGTGAPELLIKGFRPAPNSVTPDGKTLLYTERGGASSRQALWTLPLDGERTPHVFLQAPFDVGIASLSPDGRWVAYQSNETGRNQVYVRPFPKGDGKWQVSTDGGNVPLWSPDGRELYFTGSGAMWVAPIEMGSSFKSGMPRVLFNYQGIGAAAGTAPSSISPDGKRFLVVGGLESGDSGRIVVVQNWNEELKQRVPTK